MNSIKLITIAVTVILSFSLLTLILYLLTRKFKSKLNSDGKLKISFALWYAAIFISGTSTIFEIINAVFEVVDNLININPADLTFQLIKSNALIIGVGFLWLLTWFFAIKLLIKMIQFKTDEHQEMEDDNYSYFLIKAAMLIGVIFSMSSLLNLILKTLIPNIEIPFYH